MMEGANEDRPVSSRERRRVYLWIGAAALVLRTLYFSEHLGSAFFGIPILDEKYYVELARRLLEGQSPEALNPGFRPWLYAAYLASFFGPLGDLGLPVALAVQHLLGIATTMMVCSLAVAVYRRVAAGWLSGGLYLLAGPPLFFEGEVLITTLFTFLATATLWLLLRAMEAGGSGGRTAWLAWLGVGSLLGLTVQARPNILLLTLAIPCLAWAASPVDGGARRRLRRSARWSALAALGCIAVLATFAGLQSPLLGGFQWLPQSGGINLYLGNKQGADGMQPRQDQWVSYGDVYRDSVQVFAEEVYRQRIGAPEGPVDAGAVSRYWRHRTWQEVRADPVAWGGLMVRKLAFLMSAGEIPNNKSYDFVRRHESSVLRWLPIRWGGLLALAALGWCASWWQAGKVLETGLRRRRRAQLLALGLYLVLLAAGIWLFFVNGRYRIPLWPVLAALAGGGMLQWLRWLTERHWRRATLGGLLVLLLWGGSLAIDRGIREALIRPLEYRDFFYRSLAHYEKGRLEASLEDVRRSVETLESAGIEDAAVWFQQGNVALALGDDALAFDSYRRASEVTPDEPRIFNNMGILHERRRRFRDAYQGYRYALALADDYAPALVNLALLELRAGLIPSAAERLRRAVELGDRSVPALCGMAFVARAEGDAEAAARWLEEARQQDEEATLRLLRQLEEPIPPERLGAEPI